MSKHLSVPLNGNRVQGDNSLIAYPDGAFYDHNGMQYYSNIEALVRARPEIVVGSGTPYNPPKGSNSGSNHNAKAVTAAVVEMKGRGIGFDVVDKYLPFANKARIWGSIGATKSGQLAAFFFTPTKYGVRRGEHYSFAQYKTSDRWMSVTGTDGKGVECLASHSGYIYCTFGMGDFLLLKSLGINYLCFGGDGAAKNNPHTEYIKHKVAGRTIRLIADNDESGQNTIIYLRKMGLKVVAYDWKQLGDKAEPKMDLRDIGWMIKKLKGSIGDLIEYLTKEAKYV